MTTDKKAGEQAIVDAMTEALAKVYAVAEQHGVQPCVIHTTLAHKLLTTCIERGHEDCAMAVAAEIVFHVLTGEKPDGDVKMDVTDLRNLRPFGTKH